MSQPSLPALRHHCRDLEWHFAARAGDRTVSCPKSCVRPHPETGDEVPMRCTLQNLHKGECDVVPTYTHGEMAAFRAAYEARSDVGVK